MTDRERHAIWWHVYPLGFLGAEQQATDGPPVHRLRRLVDWLDYARDLGASGLALGPVFDSGTHGYDTVDHFRIDPRLGTDEDFDALVAAAGERGLRVLLDGVFNHVGRGFPAFRQVLEEGPTAPTASWFRLSWPDGPGAEPEYATFEGHRQLVALDHAEPAVADHVAAVMNHWLDRGAAGWRLDAAYAVPTSFWARVVPRVRAAHPDAYLVGEVIHGDYAGFVAESGIDSVTQYELWKAVWSSLNDANLFELSWALDRHNELLDSFVPLTFLGNHDVTRIASRLTDERHLPHALAVLFTVGGTPSVYAGDEQAFRGVKEDREGGDEAVRPAFPDSPDDLAPFGWPTYRLHQDLIGLRRRHPWMHRARTRAVELANERLCYEVRDGDRALLVALNLGDDPAELPAPGAGAPLAGAATVLPGGRVAVPGHGWAVLSTDE
ncbi:alpha-amylase family protein [Pseudonocardia lacus]|uniref:alpha-amylase family protein n=1 Tax=Pseudonocardia lacus TaxID=2835865 RepID=UPI001BDD0327|nr:alpha-amylase family protein [Pseudonocardia lacus]